MAAAGFLNNHILSQTGITDHSRAPCLPADRGNRQNKGKKGINKGNETKERRSETIVGKHSKVGPDCPPPHRYSHLVRSHGGALGVTQNTPQRKPNPSETEHRG